MSPETVPSGFDPDALLLCDACGQLGPESKVYPHIGTGPGCTAPLTLISDEQAVEIGYIPGSGDVVNLKAMAERLGEEAAELGEEDPDLSEAGPEDSAADDDDDEDDEDEADPGTVTLTKPKTRLAASPKDGTLRRDDHAGRRNRKLSLNAPRPGGVKITRPEAITASVPVKVSLYTLSLFDVARNDVTLGFDGTLEEFLDECPQALFRLLGFDGMYLLRQNQAIARMDQAIDRVLGPRAAAATKAAM